MRHKERKRETTVVGSYYADSRYFDPKRRVNQMKLEELKSVDDSTSPKPYVDPNPFFLSDRKEGCVRANGVIRTKIFGSIVATERWESYPVTRLRPSFGVDSLTPLSSYSAMALERSTPNKPDVNLGELVFGLREIPKTIRSIRKLWRGGIPNISDVSGAYLANEFGIKPLISDLSEILNLQRSLAHLARRTRRANKGDSFRGTLYKNESTTSRRYAMRSWWHTHFYDVETKYRTKVWYSTRFKPVSGSPPDSSLGLLAPTLALDRPWLTIYELIPWSFLVDYFMDFSSYLSNIQAFDVKDICIMRTLEARAKVAKGKNVVANGLYGLDRDTLRFNSKNAHEIRKERVVFTSGNYVPIKFFLSGKQITNILALASSRRY